MKSVLVFVAVALALASALPVLVEDEEGRQYILTPVESRQKRQAQLYGGGGANSHHGGGTVGFQNPNGSGAQVSYGHANGYGHDFGVDAMVPVWSSKNRLGESTINVGGGLDRHVGGWSGNHNTDKRVGISFNHRF